MYSRFKALENYDEESSESLRNSTAAVVGLGATGSVIANNLARHRVKLILIDRDYLEENDLYSSNIYDKSDVESALPKAEAAADHLRDFTEVEAHVEDLKSENIEILDEADIILDGTDNLETRLLISEYCQREQKPWIYTAAIAEQGFSMFVDQTCFNCIFSEINAGSLETCETAGIMREISGLAGSRSSMKAVRYLAGHEVDEKLDLVHSGERFDIESDGCLVCEDGDYKRLNTSTKVTRLCGSEKYQLEVDLDTNSLEKLKDHTDIIAENKHLIQTEVDGRKFTVFRSGRVIVEAVDEGHARQKVSELLGV